MSEVRFEQVEKSFGEHVAVRGIDLDVRPGEFVTLLGPSGCGKTTCLRMVAGFVAPTRGRIVMGGRDITALPPYRRNTAMVFQSYALFPHRTAAENIAFGLQVRRLPRSEQEGGSRTRCAWFVSKGSPTATRRNCPAAKDSEWLWLAQSSSDRMYCCSTSRSPRSI